MYSDDGDFDGALQTFHAPAPEESRPIEALEQTYEDHSGDGVIDRIITLLTNGETQVIADADYDAQADTLLIDPNSDGVAEIRVIRDGDSYLLSVDDSGEGRFDDSESERVSGPELEEMFPGAVDALNTTFTADSDPAATLRENPSAGESGDVSTHTVAPGDTLWDVAERVYGDGSKYTLIAEASGISNPDLIYPGQVLTLPGVDEDTPVQPASFPSSKPGGKDHAV